MSQDLSSPAAAVPFIVGCLSLSAARFIIFLAPLLALGVGMVAQGLWNLRTRSRLAAPATAVFASLVALQLYAAHGDDDRMMPLRMPYQARAMMDIASSTPATWTSSHRNRRTHRRHRLRTASRSC